MGLPQMIQSRAQFGYRGVALALAATLFVFVGFNVVNVSLIMGGLNLVFGLDPPPWRSPSSSRAACWRSTARPDAPRIRGR